MSSAIMSVCLDSLPSEIIQNILSHLDSAPASETQLLELPTDYVLLPTAVSSAVLKQISLTSHRFRTIIKPLLFKHACLTPYEVDPFLSFLKIKKISHMVKTILVYTNSASSRIKNTDLQPWWLKLLVELGTCCKVMFICPPTFFADLVGVQDCGGDEWAFNIPYQKLLLDCSGASAQDWAHISQDSPHLLTTKPWLSLTINEGSSLKSYTTYEYFLRKTPSILTALLDARSLEADTLFSRLRNFFFVAVFPFYNHVDEILKCVRKMKALQSLSIKLCPEPDRTVLQDAIDDAGGHFDISDPWTEFETSHVLISHTVIYLTTEGSLQTLHIDDVKMEFIREELETAIEGRIQQWWSYHGRGTWHRIASFRLMKETGSIT